MRSKRVLLTLTSIVGALVLACGDDSAVPDSGSDATNDGTSNDGKTSDSTTEAGDAGADAAPPVCSPTMMWNTPQLLSVSTAQSDYFGSVTSDELSIAWMTTAGSVLYADRTVATSPFNTPQTLTANVALDRVSLTSDGLTLIVVLADRSSLAQTTRGTRTAAFSTTLDTTPYAQLDPTVTENDTGTGPVHGSFADPMLSPDGQFLYYSQYGVTTYTMNESYRMNGDTTPWTQGANLTESALVAPDTTGTRRRPTGMSADDLTLFFYDETTNIERAGFRADPLNNNTYTTFIDLGAAYENAMPTANCSRIYFSSTGSGGLDLFYADQK